MTLVLTEVSTVGVAMAADSALTWNNGRSFSGAQKLIPAVQVNAGFSIWGNFTVGSRYADEWLQGFISQNIRDSDGLWSIAQSLAQELNRSFGQPITEMMGIHVAGYDTKDRVRGPAFYHVHNGHAHVESRNGLARWVPEEDPPIREFRAECDRPPALVVNSNSPFVTRNGDIAIYAFLSQSMTNIFSMIQNVASLQFPFPETLSTRGEYLRFWIQTVTEVYRLSNFRRRVLTQAPAVGETSIGGPITVLTISERGIQDFYTR